MRIKTTLNLGVGFLFIMIILLSLVGAYYINALKNDTQNILVANYNTLEYARNMMEALDDTTNKEIALKSFEENLTKQTQNITEIGEQEATELLKEHFVQLKLCRVGATCITKFHPLLRKDIAAIMDLNMQAIQRKSNIAKNTAATATFWVVLSGTLCFIIAFTLFINLPSSIASPIKELSESIKEIAAGNYTQRVHFEKNNEFGEVARSFNSMAEKLEEYNNSNLYKLLHDKKRIETLINNMHDPVIGLDEKKKILFVNEEALKILAMKEEDLIGKYAVDVAIFNDLLRSLIQNLVEEKLDFSNESILRKPIKIFANNKESYFEKEIIKITITPTGEIEKRDIGHVIILKNITPFKELDFAKTNFIATVSHELKTPIASIKMGLQLLENTTHGLLNSEQLQLVNGIKDDSDRLLKITGELLNLSQVESGNIQLNIQQSDPYQIIKYATEAIRVSAEQKQIELIMEAEENLPKVKADNEKTAWVLINFLTNAIRYSPNHSKIKISARLFHEKNSVEKSNLPMVIFSVKDQGIGIDNRYRDKIFDRYFQIPGSNRTGTGLGLTISKEFIEAQGGNIGVESEIGMGSNFFFRLLTA